MVEHNFLDLSGRNYLVTGAASGIGKAVSILLSRFGATVFILDIDLEGLVKTASECKNTTVKIHFDLLSEASLLKEITSSIASHGKLNGLVHCAGRPCIAPLKSLEKNIVLETYLLNSYAGLALAKICSNHKIYSGKYGSFIFISSVYGYVGSAANVAYAMSKSALTGLVKSLAVELAPKRIRVNLIAPGFIKSPMLENISSNFDDEYLNTVSRLHLLGLGEDTDVANAVLFLLSDMSSWITGTELFVDGGYTAK